MITWKEMLGKYNEDDIEDEHLDNMEVLHDRINILRKEYGKPLIVTSCYRSMKDHLRIYREKGITDKKKIPMKSKHLFGKAIDLVARDMEDLHNWIMDNEELMEEIGLWFEHFDATPTWCHAQIEPPRSKRRFFYP